MKRLISRLLLLFGKKRSRVHVEGGFKYRIEYKVLFGHEYILYKGLPPVDFSAGRVSLPFDSSL